MDNTEPTVTLTLTLDETAAVTYAMKLMTEMHDAEEVPYPSGEKTLRGKIVNALHHTFTQMDDPRASQLMPFLVELKESL